MEQYTNIKTSISDITYMPELILDIYLNKIVQGKCQGLNRTITYSHYRVRKLCAH